MVRKILSILVWVVTAAALIVLFVFARESYLTSPVKAVKINIERSSDSGFVKERFLLADIEHICKSANIGTVNLMNVQKLIDANPWIDNGTSYIDMDGTLNVSVKEHEPMLRVFGNNGKSVYLTEEGIVFPTNKLFSPYVLIANGNFCLRNDSTDYPLNDSIAEDQALIEALYLQKAISDNPFMKSCIGQLYRNSKGEFDITVKGIQARVILGDTTMVADKLRRAEVFFKQKTGSAEIMEMKDINFKYKNQVVCTKKKKQ